jgi:hypothetical protein
VTERPPARKGAKTRRIVEDVEPAVRYTGMLAKRFFNGTENVRYADATIEDLDGRIDYLRTKVNGLERTIQITEQLKTMMRRAKVQRLGDIPGESLAQLWAEMKDAGEID